MAALQRIVEEYGGTVPQVMGDGFMAVFGVPVAHEDDAERAVRAALAVRDHVRELNEGRDGLHFPEVHAGVNSGEVMVGPSDEQAGFAVVGDTVNTASRVADLAPAGHVFVDRRTMLRTSGAIRYGPERRLRAKGKAELLPTYEALGPAPEGPKARPGRLTAAAFVNRELVMEHLLSEVRAAEGSGSSRVLAVVGEPGIGKSRLADELRKRLPRRSVLFGRCRPFGQRLPLEALAEAVAGAAGIAPGAPRAAVDAGVVRLAARVGGMTGARDLARELGLLLGTRRVPAGQARASVREAMRAVRAVVEGLARTRPLLVVLDDFHWADPDLRRFLEDVHRAPLPRPVLFLAFSRPEAVGKRLPTLDLEAMGEEHMRELASALLGTGAPEDLLHAPLARAGGNPLFLEETLGMLIEAGAVVPEGRRWRVTDPERLEAVPSTIRLLIAARIDGLPADEKRVLQDASVGGESTWDRLIAGVSDVRDPRRALRSLEARGLLRRRERSVIPGAVEYEIKHILIREVAYESIPRAERARQHLHIAAWIRKQAASRRDEPVSLLAHHYERAWLLSRSRTGPQPPAEAARLAVTYMGRFADRVFTYQARQAEQLYARAIRIADEEGEAVDPRTSAGLLVGRAESLIEMGRHREAVSEATRARDIAERVGDGGLAARALLALGRAESDLGRMRRARRFGEEALRRFQAAHDLRGQGWAFHRLSETWSRTDVERELGYLREAHRLFVRSRDRWGRAVVAQDLAYLLTTRGGREFERSYEEARRLADDEGDLRSRSSLLRTWGYVSFYRGEFGEAIRAMREARPVAVEAGDRYAEADTLIIEAAATSAAGGPGEAEVLSREVLRLARELESGRIHALGLLSAARAAVRAGKPGLAVGRLGAATRVVREQSIAVERAEVDLVRAGTQLDRGAWGEVPGSAQRLGADARARGWALWEPLEPLLRGRASLGAGRFEQAVRDLERAVDLALAVGAGGTAELASALLEQAALFAGGRPPRRPPSRGEPDVGAIAGENRGLRELAAGRPDRAAGAFAEAVERWSAMGSTSWFARALALQAHASRVAGDRRAAARLERRAAGVLDALKTPASSRASLLRPLGA